MKYSRKGSTRSLKALWGDATPYSRSLSQISPIKASIRADRLVSAMRRSTISLSWSFGLMEVAPDGWVPGVETRDRGPDDDAPGHTHYIKPRAANQTRSDGDSGRGEILPLSDRPGAGYGGVA